MKTRTFFLLLFIAASNVLHAEFVNITVDKVVYRLDTDTHTATVINAERGKGLRGEYSDITEANIRSSITYRGASYKVTRIKSAAFEDCNLLTYASIPSSVEVVEEDAFRRCKLETVIVGAKEIGAHAFQGNIHYLTLQEGVKKIGDGAFSGSVSSLTIPNSVTKIGKGALPSKGLQTIKFGTGITRLENGVLAGAAFSEFVVPQHITSIGYSAFGDCKKLTRVVIHDKVKTIESGAFDNCTNLQSITLADGNPYYSVEDGVLFNKDKTVLIQYPSGKRNTSYTIPNGVKKIANQAFVNVPALRSITISNSVDEIGESNFSDCKNLETLKIGNSVKKIDGWVCNRCMSLTDFTIPNSVEEIGAYAFQYCQELIKIVIPGSVQQVGSDAFSNCKNLTIKVPNHTKYNWKAFNYIEGVEFYDAVNPVAEKKKAQEEQARKEREAEQKRKQEIQREKERKDFEIQWQKQEEARKKKEAQEKKAQAERAAYAQREKAYQDSIKAGKVRGQNCVDLGLSVIWATSNWGASNPQKDGKSVSAGNIEQELKSANGWRLPTSAECWELIRECTIEPVGGFLHTKSIKVISKKNGNYIIIPNAAGVVTTGTCIHLWTDSKATMVWKQTEISTRGVGADNYRHELTIDSYNKVAAAFMRCVIDKSPKK